MSLDEAQEARKKGEYKKALELYRAVLTEMPDNAKAHEGMALCWLSLQNYKKASIAASQANAFDPSLVISHLVLMYVYHHQKRSKEAESELNKAIEIDPSSPHVINAQGTNLLWKNQPAEAANIFLKALEVSPDTFFAQSVHVNLGYNY
jgi:Tfp pilus assembly protein PilF